MIYCRGPGPAAHRGVEESSQCVNEVAGRGQDLCETHLRQWSRHGKLSPIKYKVSPLEAIILAANALADAESDESYKARVQAVIVAAGKLKRVEVSEAIRRGMAEARARGTPIGPPRAAETKEIVRLMKKFNSCLLVAKHLKITDRTVRRRLRAAGH